MSKQTTCEECKVGTEAAGGQARYVFYTVNLCPLHAAAHDLLDALKALKEDYADSEGCYCGQLVGGCIGCCGHCKAVAAIAKAQGRA